MLKHRTYRYLRVAIGVTAFLLFLFAFTIGQPHKSYAKPNGPVIMQQTGSMMPMTHTMAMTQMMPMGQGNMGKMMQMMGMMMQMMGHMQEMQDSGMGMMHGNMPMSGTMSMPSMMNQMMGMMMTHMQSMMGGGMPRMGRMGSNMAMTSTMRMSDTMPMGQNGMMLMMQMMHHMHGMMASNMGKMHGTMPMSGTMTMGQGGMMAQGHKMMGSAMPMTGTMSMRESMPMHQMHMMGTMLQMMGQMMQEMGHMQHSMRGQHGMTAATAPALKASDSLTQRAQIGAITVAIEPLNLRDSAAKTLNFALALNTHSGQLDFDLTQLIILRIGDNEVKATAWEPAADFAPGAHHIRGILSFPASDAAGKLLVTNGEPVTLVIRNLGGSNEQTFTWQ
jgi:hypothetical protein